MADFWLAPQQSPSKNADTGLPQTTDGIMITVVKLTRAARPLLCVVFACTVQGQNCLAQELQINDRALQSADWGRGLVPALVPHRALKSAPTTLEIYQYDECPLGDREPLLLLHGLRGEFKPLFRWQWLIQYLSQDQRFQHRYKIYLARYSTHSSLKDVTEAFNRALRDLPPVALGRGLTIVAMSMSGNIVRNAMRDPAVDQVISRVLTLGAFFRGSPLFDADWMQQTIEKRHISPICRLDKWSAYRLFFVPHENLHLDYGWDNVDGQMPVGSLPGSQADHEVAPRPPQTQLAATTVQLSDHKFIVYAGYLHNQYAPRRRSTVSAFFRFPAIFFGTTALAHFGFEHPALRLLNHLIAETIPGSANGSDIIYPLNDGISPISSSLLLQNNFIAHSPLRNEEDIPNIRSHTNAMKARLFDNIDHVTFIDGYRPLGASTNVVDELSQTEKPRPIFAWILKDLLE